MIQRIPVESREQWLAMRKQDVTASVVGALRGLHPYTSKLRLYKEKTGFEFPDQDNVRMRRGRRLERAIAEEVGDLRPEWKITPAGVYLRDPELRLGATPDFFIDGDPRGPGVLQTKLSIAQVFDKAWRDDHGEIVPPFWIRLQTLTEMMLAGVTWGAVAVYIDHPFRDDCHIIELERHAGAEAAIKADVAQFWQDVEWGVEPDVDGKLDADLVDLMYPRSDPLETVDLTGDNYLPAALAERAELKARIADDKARIDEIEAELKGKMGAAELAYLNGFSVTFKTIDRAGFVVNPTSYRKLNVKDLRTKEITTNGQQARY